MVRQRARIVSSLVAALLLEALAAPAVGQPLPRPRNGDKPPAERGLKTGVAPVIGCPSLVNYRMLTKDGAAAAAATLADPKADHLGCAAVPRERIGAIVDRATLAGRSYDCAAIQGTTACHWVASGTLGGDENGR